ncbi:AI-2E family transporter [Pannus brasiliensis CCIBt3594]|uniref:AI-2E family transporter n=1 Tax=Pannus brasiliensis CCIBt3594 TaxID=1427578 RepID=A0AAW9QT39_9CHRO
MDNNSKLIDFIIRLFFLGLLFVWCFLLLRPFLTIILWGAILAIAWFPIFVWLKNYLRAPKLTAILLTLVGIGVIVGPVSAIALVLTDNLREFADRLVTGETIVPSPPASVAEWPVIGERLFALWQQASANLGELSRRFEPQIKEIAKTSLALAASVGVTVLRFIVSIIIAGAFTLSAERMSRGLIRFFERVAPGRGGTFVLLAASTVRNVTRGIIGVAIVQSLLIGVGLIGAGIPAAGLLTLLCLLLTLIQIGPGLIVIGSIIFAWSTMATMKALLFTLWMIPATLIDNFLKPIWMARGLPVPMVVILIGVFGGILVHGVLGLFIGPVILSLGYELIKAWMNMEPATESLPVPKDPPIA